MAKKKFYVVWKGHYTGVFDSWPLCQEFTRGYPNAKYKSFETRAAADAAYRDGYQKHTSKDTKKTFVLAGTQSRLIGKPQIPSMSVDAACSGNPGLMEYRGVDTETGVQIFRQGPFRYGTNNVGEFLALVHALAMLKKKNSSLPIYSDSRIAIGWVKAKKARTKLAQNSSNKILFDYLERAEKWLSENQWSNPILKWETKAWGEIPADFGRK